MGFLAGNAIQNVNMLQNVCCTNLVTLELRSNSLETIEDINLPNLRHLFLVKKNPCCFLNSVIQDFFLSASACAQINLASLQAQNNIKRLEGLEKLERLMTLHLRDNQIDNLDGLSPNMKCLQYLNVRCIKNPSFL